MNSFANNIVFIACLPLHACVCILLRAAASADTFGLSVP